MVRVSLADGKITSEEYRLLKIAAGRCGIIEYDLNYLIRQTRTELYVESRAAIKVQKQAGVAAS